MTTIVTGATLIDGTGADPVANASVVIEDGRIAAGGDASTRCPMARTSSTWAARRSCRA